MKTRTWKDFAVRRKERLVTTWKLRLVFVTCSALLIWGSRGLWTPATARSLVCSESVQPSDLILVDNSDSDYLSFEVAAKLRKAGVSSRVAVPVEADGSNSGALSMVSAGFVDVMARISWVGNYDVIPITEREPITLNVAYQVRDYVASRHVRSIVIAVPAFRSRRTMLIYNTVMRDVGVTVRCAPVFGLTTTANWTSSWHGIQGVAEQFIKLQYYRFAVLPFVRKEPSQPPIARAQ